MIATLEADVKEVAHEIGVEADHLAHLIRTGLSNLLTLHKEAPDTAKQIVADAQPTVAATPVEKVAEPVESAK